MTKEEIDDLFVEYARTRKRSLRNRLVDAQRGLAGHIAKDYRNRGVPYEDLRQVALIGLIKAVERYDPERGVPFTPFASRTINGELKRWFRDHTWSVRPPRSAQELHLQVRRTTETLTHELGRAPTVQELAGKLEVDTDDILDAMEVSSAFTASSIDAPAGDDDSRTQIATLGGDDEGYGRAEARVLVERLLEQLSDRDAEIVRLRFWEDLTQTEIAERVGVSQMHVSRLLRRSIRRLREMLD